MDHGRTRSLLDGDITPVQERLDVFGDEFEVDDCDFDGVVDGFRPNVDMETRDEGDDSARQDDIGDEPVRTISAHYATTPVTPTISREGTRNSTRKSRAYPNPFSSPDDDDDGAASRAEQRHNSLEFEPDTLLRRSTSSASSHMYARTQSPRFGAGPSHPYGMYQQSTMARTSSVATSSTARPSERQSFSQSVPQHPYAMYPQNIEDDLDDEDHMPVHQNPVPVGFPGISQGYTRRIGPDGEDQDIIGADGHTEQLPPYSRYPEEGPEKVPLLPPAPLHSRAPVMGTDPSMPLMHETLQPSPTPAPQSMADESALQRSATRGSRAGLLGSSSDGGSIREKNLDLIPWKEKTWKEKRHTKFCGIPFWWYLLSLCVLTFIAAVLGGVIGGFVAGGKHARDDPTVTVVTSLYDASLIASPTSVAPPTGTWALSLGLPEETQCDCLPELNQQPAWSCDLAPNAALGLYVGTGGLGKGLGANVFYASHDASIAYGMQVNSMNSSFTQFLTVQDNDDPGNGPAFYFQQYYDKVVVVPEQALSIDNNNKKHRKRGFFDPDFVVPPEWAVRRQVAHPGEKPWFCVWNSTFLEGFIYIQEEVSTTTTSSSMPSTTPPPNSTVASPSSPTPPSTTAFTQPATITPPPEVVNITTTMSAGSLTTATYTGPAAGYPSWAASVVGEAKHRLWASGRPVGDGDDDDDDDDNHNKRDIDPGDMWSQLKVFPYVLKLEERRVQTNDVTPYCQQYQILDNGHANWVGDGDGNPIIVQLDEQDPSFAAYESDGIASSSNRKRRRTVAGGCHCQWMSGEQ